MRIVEGIFQNGVARPAEPIRGCEGQKVLISFIEEVESIDGPTLEETANRIKALGPHHQIYTPPAVSLVELLADASEEPPIDSQTWDLLWAAIEEQMKLRDHADDLAEGHR